MSSPVGTGVVSLMPSPALPLSPVTTALIALLEGAGAGDCETRGARGARGDGRDLRVNEEKVE